MKPLYLHTADSEGEVAANRIYACTHPRKNEIDLRQDYKIAYDLAMAENPEEWTMEDVFRHMKHLGWVVESLDLVTVLY